jgi:hypothetical protein
MAISGHRTSSIFSRYNITSTADLDAAAEKISAYNAEHRGDSKVTPITAPVRAAS